VIAAQVLYLVMPLVAAGVVHAVVIKHDLLPRLALPLDGRRGLFGPNKTWRGVIVMVGASSAFVLVQRVASFEPLELVDYRTPAALLVGPALGLGYSLAELPNSFAKRRLGIAAGGRAPRHERLQYVVDQGDSALGATVALVPFVNDPAVLALVAALGFLLHAAFDRLLYAFWVKDASR